MRIAGIWRCHERECDRQVFRRPSHWADGADVNIRRQLRERMPALRYQIPSRLMTKYATEMRRHADGAPNVATDFKTGQASKGCSGAAG